MYSYAKPIYWDKSTWHTHIRSKNEHWLRVLGQTDSNQCSYSDSGVYRGWDNSNPLRPSEKNMLSMCHQCRKKVKSNYDSILRMHSLTKKSWLISISMLNPITNQQKVRYKKKSTDALEYKSARLEGHLTTHWADNGVAPEHHFQRRWGGETKDERNLPYTHTHHWS